MKYLAYSLVAWCVFAGLASFLLSSILKTGRELEQEYEDNESTLYLSGDDDGSGLAPHQR